MKPKTLDYVKTLMIFIGVLMIAGIVIDESKDLNPILAEIETTKKYDYNKLASLYEEAHKIDKDKYEKEYKYYRKFEDYARDCSYFVNIENKRMLKRPETYKRIYGKSNRVEIWKDEKTLIYGVNFKAKNNFNATISYYARYQCTYKDDYKKISIKKLSK